MKGAAMARIVVCGSMAYDTIMVFEDRFREHILPDKIHMLNVAFTVPQLRREFGGCAGNIAYGLKQLGSEPVIVATMGEDAQPYFDRLGALGISREGIAVLPGEYTAQAFITTDLDDNQITAFHPGAMASSHRNPVAGKMGGQWAIVAPDGLQGMLTHCAALAEAGIPFAFDPGQALPLFSGKQLLQCLEPAQVCAVNDYEAQLMETRTGLSLVALASRVKAFVVTRGAQGAWVFVEGERFEVPPVRPDAVVDPTGCGDAFRAGLLHAVASGSDWIRAVRLGAVLGAIKVASRGAQNYTLRREELVRRYQETYQEDWPWE